MPEFAELFAAGGGGATVDDGKLVISAVAESEDAGAREFCVVGDAAGDFEIFNVGCQITAEDVPPSMLIEYKLEEPCGEWQVAPCTQEALEAYKGAKFASWRKVIDSPSCEAEFRRILRNGLVTRIYDRMLFPTPEALKEKYHVSYYYLSCELSLAKRALYLRTFK